VTVRGAESITETFAPRDFCQAVETARVALIGNAECAGRGERERHGLTVTRLDEGRVWFDGTNWFTYVQDARANLQDALNTHRTVTIQYERVDRAYAFTGNVLNIQSVEFETPEDRAP
jgi:hypothetical protein